MTKLRLLPAKRVSWYECFECQFEGYMPIGTDRCPMCGEDDNFHLMN